MAFNFSNLFRSKRILPNAFKIENTVTQKQFAKSPFTGRANVFEIFLEIQKKIDNQTPASMIRLGDGEGAIMGFPELTNRNEVNRSWKNWFGDTKVTDAEVVSLSQQVRIAISEADIVGVSRKKQCEMFYLWGTVITALTELDLINDNQIITDTAIHRHLQFSLLYRQLLRNVEFIGIISSRDIQEKLITNFGVKNIKYYPIRGQFHYPGDVKERHFPDTFNRIFDTLEVPFKGAVFLVGAGVFGKVYCKWIKDRGGIALDIGSMFEPWGEIPSRTKHPCHHLDVYKQFPKITAAQGIARYNQLIDGFGMDSKRASTDEYYFKHLPKYW
jgi:hypothetical protein